MNENNFNESIEELRVFEGNLQGLIAQRQGLQMELNEVENALAELKDYRDEIYKIVSGVMIKIEKKKIVVELEEKGKIVATKIDLNEKQEKLIEGKIAGIRRNLDLAAKERKKN